jgi:hypothetical protein
MTDAPGGYQPPSDRGLGEVSGDYPGTAAPADGSSSSSKSDVAKEQAGQLGQTAKDSGRQVAATATEQAKGVADETRRQAKGLTREVASQVNEQAAAQKEKATGALRGLSDELRSMAAHNQQSGPASDLANQAADKLGEVARWLDQREPGHLVEEVRNVARRKPGAFLVGAAVAGVVVGRLTRGAVQSARNDDPDDGVVTNGFVAETYPDESTPIGTAAAAETEVLIVEDAPVASGGYAQGQVR